MMTTSAQLTRLTLCSIQREPRVIYLPLLQLDVDFNHLMNDFIVR